MEAQAGAIELPENGPVCIATRPGQYQCLATNRNGLDSTATVRVAYLGSDPIILQQPQSVALQYEEGKTLYPAALSINAIASDNRTDVLEYVWEYKVNGMWLPGEMGSSKLDLRLSDGKKVTYRCKVTDKRTGASITSNEVPVIFRLSVDYGLKFISGDLRNVLYCQVYGNTNPYIIYIYQHRIVDLDEYGNRIYTDVLYKSATIQNNYFEVLVANDYDIFYKLNGKYVPENRWAEYYIVLTDSEGQTFTSEMFSAHDYLSH